MKLSRQAQTLKKSALLPLALLAASASILPWASAAEIPTVSGKPAPQSESDWVPGDPKRDPDADLNRREGTQLGEELNNGVFDQLCRSINLDIGETIGFDNIITLSGKAKRFLRKYSNGGMASVDQFPLTFQIGYGKALPEAGEVQSSMWLGARMEGESFVVRPVSASSCKELFRLLNVSTVKTVVPVQAKRLAAMGDNELWKFPLRLQLGFAPTVAIPVGGHITVIVHAGRYKDRSTSITLYRKDQDSLRVRARFDRATVINASGQVLASVTLEEIGLGKLETLIPILGSEAAHELRRYLSISLGYDYTKRVDGRRWFLEFLLNPKDETQMDALAKLIMGNVKAMTRFLAARKTLEPEKNESQEEALERVASENAEKLHTNASYASLDDYQGKPTHGPRLKLPFIGDFSSLSGKETHDIIDSAEQGAHTTIVQATKQFSSRMIDIPYLGNLSRKDRWKNAQVYVDKDAQGHATLSVLYSELGGYKTQTASTPRETAAELNEITRYVGVRGEGVNDKAALPLDKIFPPQPEGAKPPVGSKNGFTKYALVLSQPAIDGILAASPAEIAKAYVNVLPENDKRFAVNVFGREPQVKDGKVVWKASKAAEQAGRDANGRQRMDSVGRAERMASSIDGATKDLNAVRGKADAKEKATAFGAAIDGSGSSGLAYGDALKVYLQFAKVEAVSGQLSIEAKINGQPKVSAYYVLNPNLPAAARLAQLKNKKDRQEASTLLTD